MKGNHSKLPKLREIPTIKIIWDALLREARRICFAFSREARRIFFWEPYYFLWRRLPHTRDTGPQPAHRAEAALLFLVQEAATHTGYWTSAGA